MTSITRMASRDDTLQLFHKMPQINVANILLVGVPGVGKHTLAKTIVDLDKPFPVQIRTASGLPLPPTNSDSRPRIDLVVFMVDLTNRSSMKAVETSVTKLDVQYFLGRACFVVTQVDQSTEQSVEVELISQLADTYSSPLLWLNLQSESSKKTIASQLVNLLEVASGLKPTVSSLFLEATRQPYQAVNL